MAVTIPAGAAALLGTRNRARHAVAVLPTSHRPIGPGLLLNRSDLELLLRFTDRRAEWIATKLAGAAR